MRVEEAEDEDISAGETMLGIKRTCLFKISILILSNSKNFKRLAQTSSKLVSKF